MKTRAMIVFVVEAFLAALLWPSETRWVKVAAPEGGWINGITVSGGNIFVAANSKIFLSTDRGVRWREIASDAFEDFSSLVSLGKDLFACHRYQEALCYYRDDGSRWRFEGNRSPRARPSSAFALGETLYLFENRHEAYHSTDRGKSWSRLAWRWPAAERYPDEWPLVAVVGNDIYATYRRDAPLYVSRDVAANWTALRSGWPGSAVVLDIAGAGGELYVLTAGGIYRSGDEGESWTAIGSGWPSWVEARCLAVGSGLLCAGTSVGVYLSTDGGATWMPANSGMTGIEVLDLGVTEQGLLAQGLARRELFVQATETLLLSSADDGARWRPVGSGLRTHWHVRYLGASGPNHFVLAPSPRWDGSLIINGDDDVICLSCIFISTDGGESWGTTGPDLPEGADVYCFAAIGKTLFLGMNQSLFRSLPSDTGWTESDAGLPRAYVYALVQAGTNIFAATDEGVFLSTDQGANWTGVNSGLPEKARVIRLTLSGNNLLAGAKQGTYLSADQGASWRAVGKGLPQKAKVNAFVVEGEKTPQVSEAERTSIGGRLFAGTWDHGVFMSTDNGATWKPCGTGLPKGFTVTRLVLRGASLYAVDSYRGKSGNVWRLALQ
jgi:photosystem II stability/assembly factor-like uncharacterized protein